jgi:hypothetical protein
VPQPLIVPQPLTLRVPSSSLWTLLYDAGTVRSLQMAGQSDAAPRYPETGSKSRLNYSKVIPSSLRAEALLGIGTLLAEGYQCR